MSHETSTRERRFAETMDRVASAMREFVVLVEEQVTSVNAPHQLDMLETKIAIQQVQRDVDRLNADMTALADAVDRLYTHLRMQREREVGDD